MDSKPTPTDNRDRPAEPHTAPVTSKRWTQAQRNEREREWQRAILAKRRRSSSYANRGWIPGHIL